MPSLTYPRRIAGTGRTRPSRGGARECDEPARAASRWLALCLAQCVLWLSCSAFASGDGSAASMAEYELKAALLRQLLNYVEWPHGAPAHICVVGLDPLGAALEHAFGSLRPRLRRLPASSMELPACGLVFVAASEAPVTRVLLDRLSSTGTLSVSDQPGFTEQGGMIAMRMQERRVKLRIDIEHARRAGLRVSARLLRLSELVGTNRANSP